LNIIFYTFLTKNQLIRELPSEHVFTEVGLGDCVFDALTKFGNEWVIIEAGTNARAWFIVEG